MKPKLDTFVDSERRWRERQLFSSRRRMGLVGWLLIPLLLIALLGIGAYLLCRYDVAGLSVICGGVVPSEDTTAPR